MSQDIRAYTRAMLALLRRPFAYTGAALLVAALACDGTDATPQSTAEATATIEIAEPGPEPTPEVVPETPTRQAALASPARTATVAPPPTRTATVVPPPARFAWPDWSRTARIAGAAFHLEDSEEDIDDALDALAEQNVSVVPGDSPWGWSYSAWIDDAEFYAVRDMVAMVVEKAHARGLKVVMYETGLELTSGPDRKPAAEQSAWAQRALDDQAILFNDISSDQEHWLDKGEWDIWLSPCSGYLDLSLARVREMVETGIDGLWVDTVYLQHGIGRHQDLWPSTDPCSVAAFRAATGLNMPTVEDWEAPTWRRWIVWRHRQMVDYLLALKDAAHEVNPGLVFFEENWNSDSSGAPSTPTIRLPTWGFPIFPPAMKSGP